MMHSKTYSQINPREELSFDSSLFQDLDKSITGEEYKQHILALVSNVVQDRFRNISPKQKIKPFKDRITFACPYCGDSTQNHYKKRGNIILSGKYKNYFKCFNCGMFKRVDLFFKDYNTDLNLDVINYISNNLEDFSNSIGETINSSVLFDIDNIEKCAIDRQELKNRFNLIEVKESSVLPWLQNRLQFKQENFLYNPLKNYLVILNLTPNKKIIGLQKRTLKPKKGEPIYMTYNISKLYKLFGKTEKIPDYLNTISQLFNILRIKFNLPITLFEGPLDAFLFKNSIGNAGVHKAFPFELPIRYWFDDDESGRKKAIQKIENKESVFLWEKFKKDYNIPYKKKWDLNDILIYGKKNNIKFINFDIYFSNNPLDIIDI